MSENPQWPALEYEEVAWERDADELAYVPKSRRRKITGTYRAAIPLSITERNLSLPTDLQQRITEAVASAARFDEQQAHAGYRLPLTLLRSESSASSQIEHLTANMRNIALAELSNNAPHNAKLIAGNVAAMREALSLPDVLSADGIRRVHKALMHEADTTMAGQMRTEQVWVGGTPYSPHEAKFVPPQASRLEEAIDDLVAFTTRDDIDPLTKAAVLHAQFETIHPFIDGNGRTGRALMAKSLRNDGLLRASVLPLSAGLLHNIEDYLTAFDAYHAGDPVPMIEQVVAALESAILMGVKTSSAIGKLIDDWQQRIQQRHGSRIYDLPAVLTEQPVVDSAYLADRLDLSERGARDLLNLACSYDILRPIGNARRRVYYQSDELLEILDSVSSVEAIRRLLRS